MGAQRVTAASEAPLAPFRAGHAPVPPRGNDLRTSSNSDGSHPPQGAVAVPFSTPAASADPQRINVAQAICRWTCTPPSRSVEQTSGQTSIWVGVPCASRQVVPTVGGATTNACDVRRLSQARPGARRPENCSGAGTPKSEPVARRRYFEAEHTSLSVLHARKRI